jgi:hypothetical protein
MCSIFVHKILGAYFLFDLRVKTFYQDKHNKMLNCKILEEAGEIR